MNNTTFVNVYDRVTNKIIADLEQGVCTWQKPWNGENIGTRPLRHNGEPYNGVNILLLWDAMLDKGYLNPIWMTFTQAEQYNAHVRKGEKSTFIVYSNKTTKTDIDEKTGETLEKEVSFLKGYNVFNAEQIEGLPEQFYQPALTQTEINIEKRLDKVEQFIRNTRALIRKGGNRAFYAERKDYVQMPSMDSFKDSEGYYATLLHELSHWTKHKNRLDRSFGHKKWGDEGYAKEELVAEIGAAFLCADLGITPEVRKDHVAYIDHWLKALKNDRKLIFSAAAHAGRAADYLKNLQSKIACVPAQPTTALPQIPTSTQLQL
jgi:antirestriction protein ArdC